MPKKTHASIGERLPVPIELIERRIYLIRGQKVMLDTDLAGLYKVETRAQPSDPAQSRSLPGRFHVSAISG
jgi:ORF6N domain